MTFRASTSGLDRHITKIKTDGIDLTNYEKNPVFGFGHDLYGSFAGPPAMENVIGRVVKIRKTSSALDIDAEFLDGPARPAAHLRLLENRTG